MSKKQEKQKNTEPSPLEIIGSIAIIFLVCLCIYKGYKIYNLPSSGDCYTTEGSIYKIVKYSVDPFDDIVHYNAENIETGESYYYNSTVESFMENHHEVDKSLCKLARIRNYDYVRNEKNLKELQNIVYDLELEVNKKSAGKK